MAAGGACRSLVWLGQRVTAGVVLCLLDGCGGMQSAHGVTLAKDL